MGRTMTALDVRK